MKAIDFLNHFRDQADWIDLDQTVDLILAGDPQHEVSRCLVVWMPSFEAVRYAVENNFDTIMCHEPLYWNHFHKIEEVEADPLAQEKLAYVRANKLTVLRNHDCWDRWPNLGIPWAWADFLGFKDEPAQIGADGYQHRYDISPASVEILVHRVAAACAKIGEPVIQAVGDLSKTVTKIGIGTGCACEIREYIRMGCDCFIVTDDGTWYWRDLQMAADLGYPVIRVHHGTSEEPGLVTLAAYIREHFDFPVEHYAQRAIYSLNS
jgi:putative NIF3 family GTP cyclohydrolase 1 type 2